MQITAFLGVPTLLVFYLLGAVPGIASPIDRIIAATTANNQSMIDHDRNDGIRQEAVIRALQNICFRLPANPNAPNCGS